MAICAAHTVQKIRNSTRNKDLENINSCKLDNNKYSNDKKEF